MKGKVSDQVLQRRYSQINALIDVDVQQEMNISKRLRYVDIIFIWQPEADSGRLERVLSTTFLKNYQ